MSKRITLLILLLALALSAQRKVDPRNSYYRIIAVVPMVGGGNSTDPRRPKYAPWTVAQDANGIIAFYCEPTDDGASAVVEFVARNHNAFNAILADKTLTTFEKGRVGAASINSAIQKLRKDFDLEQFGMVMP